MTLDTSKTVGILSNSVVENDPRVRRFAQTLTDAGWLVQTVGLAGASDRGELPWDHYPVELEAITRVNEGAGKTGIFQGLGRLPQRLGYYTHRSLGLRVRPAGWAKIYWDMHPAYRQIYACAAENLNASIWLSCDWEMLPIASRLQEEKGGSIFYDSHECATEQFMSNSEWRLMTRPVVKAVEASFINRAQGVVSVSRGICEYLETKYKLEKTPVEVCNTPFYQEADFNPCGDRVRLLYQGVVAPSRGLELLIDTSALLSERFFLTIRGPVYQEGYREALQARIDRHGIGGKVVIEGPVAPEKMIEAAQKADIGLMLLTAKSAQSDYALPNKVFEYMMGGLALGVSNHRELRSLVMREDVGVVFEKLTPQAVAARLEGITSEQIDRSKKNSLKAAKEYCWENECQKVLDICTDLLPVVI